MKEVGPRTILPRVADLERSTEWTSLANDIDNLVKLRHPEKLAVLQRDKRNARIERHIYQRVSMPEMQRACTVHFEDDHDTPLQRDYLEPEHSRWSWKPRTDFEREYFYKDYKDYYCDDSGRCLEPVSRESASRERGCLRKTGRFSTSPTVRGSSARYPEGLEKEHFSDSRERLHEIFEHNRYLRRQFFADMPGNAQQNSNDLTGNIGKNSQEAPKRCTGFGSTETLTSQSNQSSVSSINDRKSRVRPEATRTPEEEEEEMDTLTEFARRNLSRVINRRNGGRARRDGRVLVNILPGSEIRRADVRNISPVKLNEASNERSEGSSIVEETRFQDATSEKEMHDKSCQCRIEKNEINTDVWRRERNLPEYIFGGASKIDFKTRKGWDSPDRHRNMNDPKNRLAGKDKVEWDQFSQNETCSQMTRDHRERSDSVSANIGKTSVSRSDDGTCWDLCRSLPNLTVLKRNLDTPFYVARAVNVPEGLELLGSSDCYKLEPRVTRSNRVELEQRREQQSGQCEEIKDQTCSINRRQSASKSTMDALDSPNRLTSRREVKATRIPPPLDLSTVNERCECMEANERRCLNDYSVDVAILHNHEDHVKDLLTVIENGRTGNVIRDNTPLMMGEISRNDQLRGKDLGRRRRKSARPLYKSCGDLSLSDELQSPQLVNNCKSSTGDLRGADSALIGILPIDPDACHRDRASSPLFDQTSPIGGLHTGGSALPSTVYGPIPYSQ